MTTLSAGSSVAIVLNVDQFVTVTNNNNDTGRITASPVPRLQARANLLQGVARIGPASGSVVYGPYGVQTTLTITCDDATDEYTPSLNYTTSTTTVAAYAVDASNNVTGLVGPDGTTIVSPRVLVQSAIPFIIGGGSATAQFTIGATGALSNLTATPYTSGFAFFFMPTGITGLATGWYYGQCLSATTAQLSTATYVSGDPRLAVPTTFTNPAGITPGNYSQLTIAVWGPQIIVPGGAMGPNGIFIVDVLYSLSNTAGNKTASGDFDGVAFSLINAGTSNTAGMRINAVIANRNSQAIQSSWMNNTGYGWFSQAPSSLAINTALDKTVRLGGTIAVASDFIALDRYGLEVRYGA